MVRPYGLLPPRPGLSQEQCTCLQSPFSCPSQGPRSAEGQLGADHTNPDLGQRHQGTRDLYPCQPPLGWSPPVRGHLLSTGRVLGARRATPRRAAAVVPGCRTPGACSPAERVGAASGAPREGGTG